MFSTRKTDHIKISSNEKKNTSVVSKEDNTIYFKLCNKYHTTYLGMKQTLCIAEKDKRAFADYFVHLQIKMDIA